MTWYMRRATIMYEETLMLIKEAMGVFWQTLKDTWEELYSLAIVNLVWLFSWALPLGLASASGLPIVFFPVAILSVGIFAVTTSGIYYVANRVAHAKTFHFYDFVEGIKKGYYWGEMSWILETNTMMNRAAEMMGGRRYKTYRMYEKPL